MANNSSSVYKIAKDLLELSRKLEGGVRTSSRVSEAATQPASRQSNIELIGGFNLNNLPENKTSSRLSNVASQAANLEINAALNNLSSSRSQTNASLAGSNNQKSTSKSSSISRSSNSNAYLSKIEQEILRSTDPIESNESEELNINGVSGILLNKSEIQSWRGELPISEYSINQDSNPEILTKKSKQRLEYVQELAIRYLRPPTPPAPGEIVINQEPNTVSAPAPPIIIRQQPARPDTPEPLVVREAPPQPPPQVGRKVITISGKRLPPPPRKVVIERLAPLPSKPQSVIIERWLPYNEVKRRVIFNRCNNPDPVALTPRNVIVQWEAPEVNIRKEFKYLGIVRANPVEYVQRYGQSLTVSNDLPQFVLDIATPNGLVLAADSKFKGPYELEGDIEALRLIDLEKEGLGEYKSYLTKLGLKLSRSSLNGSNNLNSNALVSTGSSRSLVPRSSGTNTASALGYRSSSNGSGVFISDSDGLRSSESAANINSENSQFNNLIEILFKQIDKNGSGLISVEDAERLVLRLNSRLGRCYGEDDVRAFFSVLDKNNDGSLNLEKFKKAFVNLAL